jgi:hypothetical protein
MRKIFRLIFASFLAAIVAAGQTAKPAWKGTITTENGVKVVKNPAEPLNGTFAFDLQEDLKIGGDPNDAPSYFPKGGVLSVDGKGNLYMADFGNVRVQMFDKTGKFVRTIGRKGQGPGEFSFPNQVLFDAEGNTHVWDDLDFLVFGKDGTFKRKIVWKTYLTQVILGADGSIIGTTQPGFGPGGPKYTLVLLNPDGAIQRTIAEFRGEFSESQKFLVLHWYSSRIVLTPLSHDSFIYGFSNEYKIFKSDAGGRTTLVVTRDEKPQSITASEKSETIKKGLFLRTGPGARREDAALFPDHRPFFSAFLSDDAGRFYVIRAKSIQEKDAPTNVDVFSKDGMYLYKMSFGSFPAAIKNGSLYEVREDKETGEYTIVRSRIKNWEKMKTGAE